MKFGWGKGIAVVYIVFVTATLIMTYTMMTKKVDLVTDNYYEKEIKYQEQINKINNANKLSEALKLETVDGKIVVKYPRIGAVSGELDFYRPSDPAKDFKMQVQADKDNVQVIDGSKMTKGYWKVKIEWKSNGTYYYNEAQIIM
jgi:hypothetical protein